jgi:hypothetical protein
MAERTDSTERTWTETFKVEGGQLLDKVKQIIREGNVRRIMIKQGDRVVAEFPLTIGVVGAVFAPMLAAIGAIAAVATDCSIVIERAEGAEAAGAGAAAGATPPNNVVRVPPPPTVP